MSTGCPRTITIWYHLGDVGTSLRTVGAYPGDASSLTSFCEAVQVFLHLYNGMVTALGSSVRSLMNTLKLMTRSNTRFIEVYTMTQI